MSHQWTSFTLAIIIIEKDEAILSQRSLEHDCPCINYGEMYPFKAITRGYLRVLHNNSSLERLSLPGALVRDLARYMYIYQNHDRLSSSSFSNILNLFQQGVEEVIQRQSGFNFQPPSCLWPYIFLRVRQTLRYMARGIGIRRIPKLIRSTFRSPTIWKSARERLQK